LVEEGKVAGAQKSDEVSVNSMESDENQDTGRSRKVTQPVPSLVLVGKAR